MERILTSNEQIRKLQTVGDMADEAAKSGAIDRRLGALVLYAGIVDFMVIQTARLVEQIMLKGQLGEGKTPMFQPHPDSYFYQNRSISTRGILKEIKRLMTLTVDKSEDAKRINALTPDMVEAGLMFLNYRNPIVHHIGNPAMSLDHLNLLCDRGFEAYRKFRQLNKSFFQIAAPYCFSEKEIAYFYGDDTAKHDLLF